MRHMVGRIALLVLGTILIASTADAQQPKKRRGDRDKLTQTEIAEAGGSIVTARDAVRLLRPQWLTPPMGRMASTGADGTGGNDGASGAMSNDIGGGAQTVVLYIDGTRQPDLEALATVPAANIVEMRHLDPNRGVQMHGPGHEKGVIEVDTVNKKK